MRTKEKGRQTGRKKEKRREEKSKIYMGSSIKCTESRLSLKLQSFLGYNYFR
jgi:hypothetical protein